MIDSHCHLEQEPTFFDLDKVITESKASLKAVVTVCARPEDFERTKTLLEQHPGFVHACFGFHPYEVDKRSEKETDRYIEQIKENKGLAKAVGEVGLDFALVKDPEQRKKCKDVFVQFIELSKELRLPLAIHCRDAYHETIDVLSNQDARQVVFHYFGAKEFAKEIMEQEWHISIPVTVATSKRLKDILSVARDDRILAETDSPIKLSGGKLILPADVKTVIERIAEEKKMAFGDAEKTVDGNAAAFFSLDAAKP
jgi:TatD DNase family protein